MTTKLKLGPKDHGRKLTFEEYLGGDYEEGYHYEILDGRLAVSPKANFPTNWVERWLFRTLDDYSRQHAAVINFVTFGARIFVPGALAVTAPEPDLAAYQNAPIDGPPDDLRWQDMSPLLVGEVLSEEDPDKDLVRNVNLYRQIDSLREYWILDPRDSAEYPSLKVHRRLRRNWRIIDVAGGETDTTLLLPDFELVMDTRR
jgi:Uma2 family endonuclease